ncbi:MAG: hypothetical protein IKU25_09425 [Clostridia bacterium]|nr:hypothetical protein [Clostridia bacterium]
MSKKEEAIARMAVLGCHRNPQAHTVEECCKCDFKRGMCDAYRMAENLYENGFAPVIHSFWERVYEFSICHNCGYNGDRSRGFVETKYCPQCGAKMHEEEQENENS